MTNLVIILYGKQGRIGKCTARTKKDDIRHLCYHGSISCYLSIEGIATLVGNSGRP
jgi:hypothetical protein